MGVLDYRGPRERYHVRTLPDGTEVRTRLETPEEIARYAKVPCEAPVVWALFAAAVVLSWFV